MKRFLVALALVLGLAGPAQATTYYVKTTGSDDSTGTTIGKAWQTIGKANSTATTNDVVLVSAGTYSGSIAPTASGVTFIGDSTAYNKVIVSSADIDKQNTTLTGFRVLGDITTGSGTLARGLLARKCLFRTGADLNGGWVRFESCKFGNDSTAAGIIIQQLYYDAAHQLDDITFNACTFKLRNITTGDVPTLFKLFVDIPTGHPLDVQGDSVVRINRFRFTNNNVSVTFPFGTDKNLKAFFIQRIHYANISDNNIYFRDSTGSSYTNGTMQALVFRDGLKNNLFDRDTITAYPLIAGTGITSLYMTSSGNNLNQNSNNSWRSLFVKNSCPVPDPFVWNDGLGQGDSLSFCTFVDSAGSVKSRMVDVLRGNASVFRNAFVTFKQGGAVRWDFSSTAPYKLTVRQNIFYCNRTGTGTSDFTAFHKTPSGASSMIDSDYNLYFFGTNGRDVSSTTGTSTFVSGVGSTGQICTSPGVARECHSVHGTPRFADSTYTTFNPHPYGGAGLGIGEFGGDAGPIDSVADAYRPAPITDLSVITMAHGAVLTWTAVGDDSLTGTATAYDVYVDTSRPDLAGKEFNSIDVQTAYPAYPNAAGVSWTQTLPSYPYYYHDPTVLAAYNWPTVPRPAVAGTVQTMNISFLIPGGYTDPISDSDLWDSGAPTVPASGTVFYIAIYSVDDVGHISKSSNWVPVTVP